MMTKLVMLTPDDKLAEIRRLYFETTRQTIQDDLAKALDLLKTMNSEEERERATMRKDWGLTGKQNAKKKQKQPRS
jgi:hypothetical protein